MPKNIITLRMEKTLSNQNFHFKFEFVLWRRCYRLRWKGTRPIPQSTPQDNFENLWIQNTYLLLGALFMKIFKSYFEM